jgi:hypothetical protein
VIAATHTHSVAKGGGAAHTSKSKQVAVLNGEEVEGKGKKGPYLVFSCDKRLEMTEELKKADPDFKPTDMVKKVSALWHAMSAEEKSPYTNSRLRRTRFAT